MANKSPDSSEIPTRPLVINLQRLSPASEHRSGTASEQEDSDQEIRRLSEVLGGGVDQNQNKGATPTPRRGLPSRTSARRLRPIWYEKLSVYV
jgi:hypothetical protein